jgi:hypothetical protein
MLGSTRVSLLNSTASPKWNISQTLWVKMHSMLHYKGHNFQFGSHNKTPTGPNAFSLQNPAISFPCFLFEKHRYYYLPLTSQKKNP